MQPDAQEKVLRALDTRPLPMHVLFAQTGLPDDDVRAAVNALQAGGKVFRHGDLVGKPSLPAIPSAPPVEEPSASNPELEPVQGPDVEVGDPGFLGTDADEPEAPDPESRYYVATAWQEIEADDAESAADIVLSVEGREKGEVLVMLAEEAILFERRMVTRRRA